MREPLIHGGLRDVPMTPERDARGRVAAVYTDIRRILPFVPSFFKSLAVNPEYLELAWLQVRAVSTALDRQAAVLFGRGTAVADRSGLPVLPGAVRAVLTPFRAVVPRMVLTVELLTGLLEGTIEERPPPAFSPLPAGRGVPDPDIAVVEPREAPPGPVRDVFADIQVTYGVPLVTSLFRALAAARELEPAWSVGGPVQRSAAGRELAERLRLEAVRLLHDDGLTAAGFAGPRTLEAAGQGDALSGLLALLDLYRIALPQAFVFLTLAREPAGPGAR